MKTKNINAIVLAAVVLGGWLMAGLYIAHRQASGHHQGHHDTYYCPMHPFYTSDRPGICPICFMDLVKRKIAEQNTSAVSATVYKQDTQTTSGVQGYVTIFVTAQKQQLIGIRTVVVSKVKDIVIPRDAVMDTGIRKIVFVEKNEGTFEPRVIQTGRETDDGFEVKSGLKEGEKIVTSGNFLLDSESRVQAGLGDGGDTHD